jgi:hypothetical protein
MGPTGVSVYDHVTSLCGNTVNGAAAALGAALAAALRTAPAPAPAAETFAAA